MFVRTCRTVPSKNAVIYKRYILKKNNKKIPVHNDKGNYLLGEILSRDN